MESQAVTMELGAAVGQRVGNYVVRRRIGEGGMGMVYLAEHASIGKQVAVKILHPELAAQPVIVERFFCEAKAVNDIRHENIVDVIDFGVLPGEGAERPPVVYLIMELLEGVSLSEVIEREAPLPPERAIRIGTQIADALGAAHGARIVHRDLKPDNVMLVRRGREQDFVKVLDFGIAKQVDQAASEARTRAGAVIGTPRYMAPEQCQGRGHVDSRADIYSLGIVLYQMLTGAVPFDGEGLGDILVQQMAMPPLAPTVLNPRLGALLELVVLKALEKQADDRYQRMEELIAALRDPPAYVKSRGGAERFLRAPILRDPAQSSAGGLAAARVAQARPAGTTTTLSGSAAQLGAVSAARRHFGLAVTAGAVVGAVVGASLLLHPGRESPGGRDALSGVGAPDERARLAPAAVTRPASMPASNLAPGDAAVAAPALPRAAEAEPAIQMEPVIVREPTRGLGSPSDHGAGRDATAAQAPGGAAVPPREPTRQRELAQAAKHEPAQASAREPAQASAREPTTTRAEPAQASAREPATTRAEPAQASAREPATTRAEPARPAPEGERSEAGTSSRDGIKNPFASARQEGRP